MGFTVHHTIIVTSIDQKLMEAAKAEAERVGCVVIGPSPPTVNGHITICIVPDGSKEGWGESDAGDVSRSALIEWINRQAFEDGSNMLNFVEVAFGGDMRAEGFPETVTRPLPAASR